MVSTETNVVRGIILNIFHYRNPPVVCPLLLGFGRPTPSCDVQKNECLVKNSRTKEDKDDFQFARKRRDVLASGETRVCVDVSMLFAATARSTRQAASQSLNYKRRASTQKFLSDKFRLHLAPNLHFGHELTLLLSEILLCFLSFSVIISFVLVSSSIVLVLIVLLCLPCKVKAQTCSS